VKVRSETVAVALDAITIALALASRLIEASGNLRALFAELDADDSATQERMDEAMAGLDAEIARGKALREKI
jgi:hypothetical protein